jgi:hypothetical protein
VPSGLHWHNAAKRAIRTFKNHFISSLVAALLDKHFPLYLWDKLLSQAELTLNLLRRLNPKLSAYAQLHGPVDPNAHGPSRHSCSSSKALFLN